MDDREYYRGMVEVRGWVRVKFMAKNRPSELVMVIASPFVMTYFIWVLASRFVKV